MIFDQNLTLDTAKHGASPEKKIKLNYYQRSIDIPRTDKTFTCSLLLLISYQFESCHCLFF